MAEQRKFDSLEEFRRHPQQIKSSRAKQSKPKLATIRNKEVFLTDTQTSDYTKSSNEFNTNKAQYLQDALKKLKKENAELKDEIIQLKTNQFFMVNQEKLKGFIMQTEKLKDELDRCKKELEQSLIQRDFLERFNKNLKNQCQSLTKEIYMLKNGGGISNLEQLYLKNHRNSGVLLSEEEIKANKTSRSSSNQTHNLLRRKENRALKKEKEEIMIATQPQLLKNSYSSSALNQEYFVGKSIRDSKSRKNQGH